VTIDILTACLPEPLPELPSLSPPVLQAARARAVMLKMTSPHLKIERRQVFFPFKAFIK